MFRHDTWDPSMWMVIVALTADSLSIIGCVWLVCRLRSLSTGVKARLFPRQLQSLAIADGLFHLAALPLILIDFAPFGISFSVWQKNLGCRWAYAVFRGMRFVCLLQEMHVAVSFMVQAFRWVVILPVIDRLIAPLWALGYLLGVILAFQDPFHYDARDRFCEPDNWGLAADAMSVSAMIACGIVCAISYVTVILRSYCWSCPGSVQRNNFRRASIYPLNFMLTYGMVLLGYCNRSWFDSMNYTFVSATLEYLSGFMNFIAYAMQSRYATKLQRRRRVNQESELSAGRSDIPDRQETQIQGRSTFGSFHVDIGGVDFSDIVSSVRTSGSWIVAEEPQTEQNAQAWLPNPPFQL